RLDIKHDVGLLSQSERPPGHVTDHHPAVASSAPGGGEGAATFYHRHVSLVVWCSEMQAFQTRGRHRKSSAQLAHLHCDVRRYDVQQIDPAAHESRARIGGSVGDALHLLENLVIEAAEEQSIRHGARLP